MKSGIYIIRNTINDKIYIGSAVSFKQRFIKHKSDLKLNQHHSIYLQRSWNKYGKDKFIFEIVEYVEDKTKLIEREQRWLDFFNPEYNTCPTAGNSLGYKHTDKSKKIMSDKKKRKVDQFDLNGNFIKTFDGIHIAQKELNITHISDVCIGTMKRAGNFIFKYNNK